MVHLLAVEGALRVLLSASTKPPAGASGTWHLLAVRALTVGTVSAFGDACCGRRDGENGPQEAKCRINSALPVTKHGWSQTRLISELENGVAERGMTVMAPSSLRTAVSRWENGHVVPEVHYPGCSATFTGQPKKNWGSSALGREPTSS